MRIERVLMTLMATLVASGPVLSAPLTEPNDEDTAKIVPPYASPVLPSAAVAKATAAARHRLVDANGDHLSDGLAARFAGVGASERLEVIVTFADRGSAAAAKAQVGGLGATHDYQVIPAFAASVTTAQAHALSQAAGVLRVEENAQAQVFLEAARNDFGAEQAALDFGLDGDGLTVCVIDTGLAADHEQFVEESSGGAAGKVLGFMDFVGDSNGQVQLDPYDDHGHGSHVTSIILGDGTGSAPLAGRLRGVAPAAQVYAAKVLDANGVGDSSAIIAAIDWCLLQGSDVINMSLGVPGGSDGQDALSLAANAAVDAGAVVVVAAGNEGDGPSTIGSPGAADKVITVGAAADWSGDPSDPDEAVWASLGVYPAPFSSRGPALDGDIKPDILGPGVTIAAALGDYQGIYAMLFGCVNDCYIELSGTSMATPYVAGVVALMRQANPGATPAEIAQTLYTTAQDHGAALGKDNVSGHGLVDALAAVEKAALGGVFNRTAFPGFIIGSDTVPDGGEVWIPVPVDDISAPVAITVTIDGQVKCLLRQGPSCLVEGLTPDLEAQLYDPNQNPYEEPNLLYPWLSPYPTIAVLGTQSTCPAGNDCGLVGVQETLYFRPDAVGTYWLRVYPFDGSPNNGKGGDFTYQISHGPAVVFDTPMLADARLDQSVTDADKNGVEQVTLDAGASGGPIVGWLWSDEGGAPLFSDTTVVLDLAVGSYVFWLTVDDGNGGSASDSLTVTVAAGKKGGGGNGGGGNGGGRGGPKPK